MQPVVYAALASALASALALYFTKRRSNRTGDDKGESSPTATTTKYQLLPESFRHETLPNTVLDESLPIPASILWQTLFGTDVLMARFYHRQQYTNLHLHAWEDHKHRTVTYTKRIKPTPFAPPAADCIENFLVIKQSPQGFVVNVAAVTPKVPFGDNFHCQLQFVGEALTSTTSRLCVHTEVKFTKTIWLKGVIAKEAHAGMRETYKAFAEELHTHVQQQYPAAAQGAGRNKVPHRVLEGKPAIRIKVLVLEQQIGALLEAQQGGCR